MVRKLVVISLVIFGLINMLYWQDPWLWRNYVQFLSSGEPQSVELMVPSEEIYADGSYVLPVATDAERTISAASFDAMPNPNVAIYATFVA